MTVQCITCTHVDMQANKQMTAMGLPRCHRFPDYRYVSLTHKRDCKAHKLIDAAVENKRRSWWAKQCGA